MFIVVVLKNSENREYEKLIAFPEQFLDLMNL